MKFENAFKSGKDDSDYNLVARAVIVSMAHQIGLGQWASQLCPQCDGGASKERSLSMNVQSNGVIDFYCHRAACGFAGKAYSTPGAVPEPHSAVPVASHLNPLDADLYPLGEKDLEYFAVRYHIGKTLSSEHIRRTTARYALHILSPTGAVRGWITRRPYDGSPGDTAASRTDAQYSTKALTFLEADEPAMSWYHSDCQDNKYRVGGIYLVEDQLSAMRLVEYFNAESIKSSVVAILGTGVNAAKIGEIQRVAHGSRVSICLDRDATGQAFAMARKWHAAFAECRVIVLDKDIKDSSDSELAALPL